MNDNKKLKWKQTDKEVSAKGTTITYECAELPGVRIESRKVHIPHANGRPGSWDHTSYFVLTADGRYHELWTLKKAKEIAERIEKEIVEQIIG